MMMTSSPPTCRICRSSKTKFVSIVGEEKVGGAKVYEASPARAYRCLACRGYFLERSPGKDELRTLYSRNQMVEESSENPSESWKHRVPIWRIHDIGRKINRLRPWVAPEEKILDVGCHFGNFLQEARDRLGLNVTGLEIWDAAQPGLEQAGISHHQMLLEDFARLSANRGEPGGERFDIITMFDVLEHVSDLDAALDDVFSLLNEGGIFMITCPNAVGLFPNLFHTLKFMQHPGTWDPFPFPFHLWIFTRRGLKAAMARHGLRVNWTTTDSTHEMTNARAEISFLKRMIYTPILVFGKWIGLGNRLVMIATKSRS